MPLKDKEDAQALLKQYAESYSIVLAPRQVASLIDHVEIVLAKNEKLNLTRVLTLDEALIKHIVDSLLFAASYASLEEEGHFEMPPSFVDIGTGPGFPGIPFAIATGLNGTLLDSAKKKAAATSGFVKALGLSRHISVRGERVENFAQEKPASFDLALSRAVAPLGVLLEYASPLLREGGFLLASKGNPDECEVKNAQLAASLTGMEYVSRETFELPLETGHREMFIYQKVREASRSLPRRPGMATKKPLYTLQ